MLSNQRTLMIVLMGCGLCCGQEQQTAASMPIFATNVVKGMPFSAKVVTESNQPLVDGNRISRTSVASIARDSEGRTRREQGLSSLGAESATTSIVFIQDPVSGSACVLDPQSRVARKWSISFADSAKQSAEIRGGSVNAESTSFKTEMLGMQLVEGIVADGTRLTRTLAAGQAGNEHPLNIMSETWYSNELQVVVLSRTTDPRLGESISRLTEVQRGEPLHSLFEIPADYTIREEPGTLQKSIGR